MEVPRDTDSIRRVLEQAAGAAFRRAQAQMENMNIHDAQNVRHLLEHAATEAIARAQEFEIPMASFHGQAVGAVEEVFMGIWPILKRVLILYSIGISIMASSIAMYGLFYFAIQPGQAASELLFFDYSGIANHPAPEIPCENQTCSAIPSGSKITPWAAADFFAKHSQWEAFHTDVLPKPLVQSRVLQPGKGYFLEINLELPESNLNRDAGIFMVHVYLQASNGTMLASSIRPARLPHESLWIATIRKSFWLIPMIIGASHEARTVVVPSFRHFRESLALPLQYATVSLVMQGKDSPERKSPLEVTRGEIRIGKELTDFQFLLREYFFTCYIVGVLILSIWQAIGLLVMRAYWKMQQRARILRQMQEEAQEDPSETLDLDESQLEHEEPGAEQAPSDSNNEWEDLPQDGVPHVDTQSGENEEGIHVQTTVPPTEPPPVNTTTGTQSSHQDAAPQTAIDENTSGAGRVM